MPEGEDYVRPAGMIGLNTVIAKAVKYDTPQARAVIATGSAGIGAILGHAVTDSSSGADIGAIAGLGITAFCYWSYGISGQLRHSKMQPSDIKMQLKKTTVEIISQPNFVINHNSFSRWLGTTY